MEFCDVENVVCEEKGGLWYVAQRCCDNEDFWREFAKNNDPPNSYSDSLAEDVQKGSIFFTKVVNYKMPKSDKWIAAIVSPIVEHAFEGTNFGNTEIFTIMTVTSGYIVPFTTHMGIFKTLIMVRLIERLKKGQVKIDEIPDNVSLGIILSRNTSIKLHQFAMKYANIMFARHYREKEYMCTTPTHGMRDILTKNLPESLYSLFSEFEKEALRLSNDPFNVEKVKKYFPKGIDNYAPSPMISNGKFRLKSGEIVEYEDTPVIEEMKGHYGYPWMCIDLDAGKSF